MEFRTLSKRGRDHLNYEDDLFFFEHPTYNITISTVFDGCSTGINSKFASSLFAKIIKRVSSNPGIFRKSQVTSAKDLSYEIMQRFITRLEIIASREVLDLTDLEMVSTLVLCVTVEKQVAILVFGDGGFSIDGIHYQIESPNNAPNYIAYHIKKDKYPFDIIKQELNGYFYGSFDNEIAIYTDGVYSFTNSEKEDVTPEIQDSLLSETNLMSSEAMLARKYNILLKKGYSNFDDVTIIRLFNGE